MDISVVIPLLNEEESIQELYDWIASTMQSNQFLYEIIFIDDGSNDSSWQVIENYSVKFIFKGNTLSKNYGKSQALDAGFTLLVRLLLPWTLIFRIALMKFPFS